MPAVNSNTITNTQTYDGLALYESSPYVYRNTISGNHQDGVQGDHSSAVQGYYQGTGENDIHDNGRYEVYALNGSDMLWNTNDLYGALGITQSIADDQGVRVKAVSNCAVTAERVWWGGYPVQSGWFDASGGGHH